MKKIFAFLLVFILLTVNAFAYFVELEEDNTFSIDGPFTIHNIDTDGKIFVGVLNNKIVISADFSKWERVDEITGISAVLYLAGKFNAFGDSVTYTSTDGVNWEKHNNNLGGVPDSDYIIKNKNSVVAFVYDKGTFQTYDGINWNKVENIPDGIKMHKINNKIVFFSDGYMRGLYYSDTGESFKHVVIDGFNESYGGNHIGFRNGEYVIEDYWAPVKDETYCIVRYSTDLENWESRMDIRPELAARNGSFVVINGEICEFSLNGFGKYNMTDGMYVYEDGSTSLPPYVNYNFTDFGVFGWSTNNFSYFVKNDGTMLKFDGRDIKIISSFVKDNLFYGITQNGTVWRSETGTNWGKADETASLEKIIKNTGSNGKFILTTEFIERGSQSGRDINSEITGEILYDDGTTEKVAYEYAKDDYVKVIGGNGFFLLGGFSIGEGWYYSRDGVTREFEIIGLPYSRDVQGDNLIANDKYFIYFSDDFGTIKYGQLSQFEQFNSNDKNVRVKLNDEYLSFATPPIIQDGRTLVPVRFLFERAGAKVLWNDADYSVIITLGEREVKLKIGETDAYVNGELKVLDVPAQLINDKTLIPLRFISEELGFTVNWDDDGYTVEVYSAGTADKFANAN